MKTYHVFRTGLALAATLCFAAAMPAPAQSATAKPTTTKSAPAKSTDVDGFKGMRWGSNLADLQRTKTLVLTKETEADGSSLYALQNEALRYGKATLSGIHCSFAQERLQGVILLFSGASNFAAMKTEATAKFGESVKIDQKGDEMYSWVGKTTSILLSYNRRSQTGFLFMKPIKPLKPIKSPKPTQAAQAAKPPIQPTPPVQPATRPTPPSDDLETALDRASLPETPQASAPSAPSAPPASPTAPSYPATHKQESAPAPITPDIQTLIDRDQALTRLCWSGAGAAADEACRQMRESVQRLQSLGMCMSPGNPAAAEPEVVWSRCNQTATPASAPVPAQAQANPKEAQCGLVAEMFTAAAEAREEGASPLVAEEELTPYQSDRRAAVSVELIRETVELVYFDPNYASLWGNPLAEKVRASCLQGNGPYAHPLP
jgi:hypothetical protein